MDALIATTLAAFGLLAGIIGGLLGTGGCVIMLPALHFIFGYDLPMAVGTTVTAVVITATSGALAHIRVGNVDRRTALVVAVSGSVGAVVGSLVFTYVAGSVGVLSLVLGLAFLYVSLRMVFEGFLRRGAKATGGNAIPGRSLIKALIGFFIGALTGILGLGGGYALVPAFIYVLGSPVKIAVGTSMASFISMASVSAGFKIYQNFVDVIAAICLGVGTAVGAQVGARLVPKTPAWLIKGLFGLVFLYVSLKFILKPLGITI